MCSTTASAELLTPQYHANSVLLHVQPERMAVWCTGGYDGYFKRGHGSAAAAASAAASSGTASLCVSLVSL